MDEFHEPLDEAYDDDGTAAELPYSAACSDACSAMVEAIANVERTAARERAWQVEMIDDARRMAEASEHGLITVGSTMSASKRFEMVRRNLVAEIACALRMPEVTVDGMVTTSEELMTRFPLTMDALREGEISYRHAEVLVDQGKTLSGDIAIRFEDEALPEAMKLTVTKFRAQAKLIRERLDPDSITERVARSAKDRRLDFVPADDGMAWLNLYTTAPEATSIYTAVRDYARGLQHPADPRTLTQITADAYTDALAAALSGAVGTNSDAASPGSGSSDEEPADWRKFFSAQGSAMKQEPVDRFGCAFGRIRPTVTVTVPALTLLGVSDEPGMLEGYGPIDPDTARELAGQSTTWYRLLTDPSTGVPISLDSTKYRPSKAMKRFLRYRDGTCRFPGCNRAAKHCDIDHTQAAEFGGPTQCDNLSHLCRKHHRLKHQTTWRVAQTGAGRLEWTSPGNRTYATEPAVLFPPGPAAPDDSHSRSDSPAPTADTSAPPVDDGPPPF
ncbi:cytoskeletal protein CcmA (bactofilin family) [Okibacterium sp. HSC-33S16]|uniref:HNH endonuclease signature motif containing protein n=1 Tax=Okibacterium sp. HSC-33S16 TaxID=2910965 RepID=UPI00209CB291|nr:HNH endonuclease signature motif containing protein [Okibacterium sp. HSC-33S16]MCP2031022.1 cytoskeletal protein CcmA (bactofilin family) [Okibacterium sp. HSC-33S16]